MNFVTGTVEDDAIRLRFARLALGDRLRSALARLAVGREVLLGLRPEDLEPVAPGADGTGLRFPVVVDTVESTGADVYAHVRVDGRQDDTGHLDRLLADDGDAPRSRARDGASRIVARLDAASGAEPGRRMTLGIDPEHLYVFDAATGDALAGANRDAAEAEGAIPSGEAAAASA
jgi:multiple sugar transport system ATP-binding protein